MSSENRTEQATPRRRQKARDKGQVARSRDFSAAIGTAAAVGVFSWQASSFAQEWRELFYRFVQIGFERETPAYGFVISSASIATLRWVGAPMAAAWFGATAATLAQGGFVFAPEALGVKVERLNPTAKLKQIFSASGLSSLLKSLFPFGVIAYVGYSVVARDWSTISRTMFLRPLALWEFVGSRVYEMTWKSLLVLLLWSGLDYLLVRLKMERDLRMTRQEVREEAKESDGNPQVKARMRRLQRQVRRRKMLQDVQRATVVVTNPTHFAIALEYRPEMAAPVVLAKGRNLLAEEIKQAATWHGVPQVENVPLAHALYRSVEVGQSIPAKLYAGVAEVLAFIYRTNQQAARAGGAK